MKPTAVRRIFKYADVDGVMSRMFNCRDSIHLLLDFLDGDMPEDEAVKLQEHLAQCPPCVDFLRTYRATPGLCRRALQKQMPQQLSDKLTEFLRAKVKKA